ncbi:MAG: hypothetical protein ACYC06_00135 [Ilumatobacteraceae bacterium]
MSLAVVSILLTGLSSLSIRLVRDSRAQIAADAAALAGVIGGESAAQRLALVNGAVLCEFVRESVVAVRVCIGSTTARAYAREQQDDEMPTLKP